MAIALDATSNSGNTTGTLTATLSHTISGSNTILFVATINNNATPTTVTGVTYNGVAMTNIGWQKTNTGSTLWIYLWYIINPTTGANNIVATKSGTFWGIVIKWVSFTGVKQSAQPDSSSTSWPTTTTSYAPTTTTVADNCFSILCGAGTSGSALTAWTNTTISNAIEVVLWGLFIAYSTTAKTPAGTDTITVTSSSQEFIGIMASFSPFTTSTNSNFLIFF